MKKDPRLTTSSTAFERYNHTELYQTCMRAGILVRPNEALEDMIAYLEGWKEPPSYKEEEHAIHDWRNAFIKFFHEYWKRIETQVTCPAKDLKTTNPRPCYGCTDTHVIACSVMLKENAHYVEKHLLVRRPKKS